MSQEKVRDLLIEAGQRIRERIFQDVHHTSAEELRGVFQEKPEDTIFQIDRNVEELLVPLLDREAESLGGIWLLAEGIGDPENGLFLGVHPGQNPSWAILADPIDGTRELMYNKRSAFFLAGAAPWKPDLRLQDIEVAVMTELATAKMACSDSLWALKGKGLQASRYWFHSQKEEEITVEPSRAPGLKGGFGQLTRFAPPGREVSCKIEDELIALLYPDMPDGRSYVFEDQYISTGGQLYELLMGHGRYNADIRDVLYAYREKQGLKIGHVCHPYDLCASLIGLEAGIELTDSRGQLLNPPFSLQEPAGWIGYANKSIRAQVEPVLLELLQKEGLV